MLQGNGRVPLWFRKRNQKASRWTVVLLSSWRDKHLNIFRNCRDFPGSAASTSTSTRASTAGDAGLIPGWIMTYHMPHDEAKKIIKIIKKKKIERHCKPTKWYWSLDLLLPFFRQTVVSWMTQRVFQVMETICVFLFLFCVTVWSVFCLFSIKIKC